MSDESDPPSLRLRPRSVPKTDEAAEKPAAEKPASESAAADSTPSLRLKPKLSTEPKAQPKPEKVAPESSPDPAAAKPRVKPRLSISDEGTSVSATEHPTDPATLEPSQPAPESNT
jgi:hypothetical protein